LQEIAIVGHEQIGEWRIVQQAFQPHDAFEIEMVRRLVEEHQRRLAHQFAGHGHPLLPAAGQRRHRLFRVGEAEFREHDRDFGRLLVILQRAVVEGRDHRLFHGVARLELRFLRQVGQPRRPPQRYIAGVRRLAAGEQLEQRRLAGAVGPDEADAFAVRQVERQTGKQRPARERLRQRLAAEQHCHTITFL
jgi:hypothetical protein